MSLKNNVRKIATNMLVYASPLVLPIGMGHLESSVLLQKGFSKEYIERQYREGFSKERPTIGPIAELVKRPGRELAYITTDLYKFPWKGYNRKVFRWVLQYSLGYLGEKQLIARANYKG